MANINNLKIGACQITYKTQDVGHTLGGVKLTYERKFTDLNVDKYGDAPIDKALTSTKLMIVFKAAEPVVALLQRLLWESNNAVSGSNQRLGLGADAGYSARGDAGLLVLHPTAKAASDTSEDVNIYQAVNGGNIELNYEVNNQRVYEVHMEALIDESYVNGRRLGHIGPTNIS